MQISNALEFHIVIIILDSILSESLNKFDFCAENDFYYQFVKHSLPWSPPIGAINKMNCRMSNWLPKTIQSFLPYFFPTTFNFIVHVSWHLSIEIAFSFQQSSCYNYCIYHANSTSKATIPQATTAGRERWDHPRSGVTLTAHHSNLKLHPPRPTARKDLVRRGQRCNIQLEKNIKTMFMNKRI